MGLSVFPQQTRFAPVTHPPCTSIPQRGILNSSSQSTAGTTWQTETSPAPSPLPSGTAGQCPGSVQYSGFGQCCPQRAKTLPSCTAQILPALLLEPTSCKTGPPRSRGDPDPPSVPGKCPSGNHFHHFHPFSPGEGSSVLSSWSCRLNNICLVILRVARAECTSRSILKCYLLFLLPRSFEAIPSPSAPVCPSCLLATRLHGLVHPSPNTDTANVSAPSRFGVFSQRVR